MQKHLYYEVRQRFGLSAQLAIRAIAKTVAAYKRDTSHLVTFRQRAATARQTYQAISKQLVAHAKDTKAALGLEDLTHIRGRMTVRRPVQQAAQLELPPTTGVYLVQGRAGWCTCGIRGPTQYQSYLLAVWFCR